VGPGRGPSAREGRTINPRRVRTLWLVLAAASLSCSLFLPDRGPSTSAIGQGIALFLASSEPNTLDPARWTGSADGIVGDLFGGLLRLDSNLQLVPDLAESWDISPDGTVYTFQLRRDVVFHTGRAFTAQDVTYSWERALDPSTGSTTAATYLGDIRRVSAADDFTLVVTLDSPKVYFLAKLAYPTSWVVDRETADRLEENPVGTGPFQLLRRTLGREIVLERNPRYHLGPVRLGYVVYRIEAGHPVRLYEAGEIDMTGLPEDLLDRARDPSDTLYGQIYPVTPLCTYYTVLDTSKPPFDDLAVRRAFALAVDREALNQTAFGDRFPVADGLYPPGLPGFSSDVEPLPYDPQAARQAMAESRYGGGQDLPEFLLTDSGAGTDLDPSTAFLVQAWQETLGVTVQVEQLESFGYSERIYSGDHGQIVPWGWCADYPDPENFVDVLFHSGGRQNIGLYANPRLDRLLEQARNEPDVASRLALYRQAEQIVIDDAAAIFMIHSATHYVLVKPHILGYQPAAIGVAQNMNLSLSRDP
jgi:oligopeptide transport system substrate-binding protein